VRETLEDILSQSPIDPTEAARRNMRAQRRRFYERAEAAPSGILLDGRPVRTPAKRALAAPTAALAEALAAEWRAQGEFIDPLTMPLTRLASTIIDGVAAASDSVAAEVAKYLASDLICYRADAPAELVARQAQHWDPLVAWAREGLGAELRVATGIIHLAQPEAAIIAARVRVPRHPWRLGAVHAITTLTGSAVIALAVAAGAIDRDAAWAAAHVDEDWNMEFWGRDEVALGRRAVRFAEMAAATQVLQELPQDKSENVARTEGGLRRP
jgi:chaperone required for assembly of F1-ATPase